MRLNKYYVSLVTVVATIVFTGCSAKGAKFTSFEQPNDGKSMVYVYRPASGWGGAINYTVKATEDNKTIFIADIKNGSYGNAEVSANKEVEIWAKTESKTSITLDTESNKTYCIRAGVGMGIIVGRPTLEQVDMETCQKEIVETVKPE